MLKVKDILERKGNNIYAIDAEETVYDALEMLVEKNVGALVITDHGRHIGIFTERDYARKVILKGKASRDTRVHDIMSEEYHTVNPDEGVEECMEMMTQYRVRHLPVEENDKLV